MPLKPSSVYVILENPQHERYVDGVATRLFSYRVPLDNKTPEDVAKEAYTRHPVGTRVVVVEDTKVTAYNIGMQLELVEDIRLK